MKPLALRQGIQFLTPEQQRMVALPVHNRANVYEWAERLEVTPGTVYNNAKALAQLGLLIRHFAGQGTGEISELSHVRRPVGRLLDINNTIAPILDSTVLEQRLLYLGMSNPVTLQSMLGKGFSYGEYARSARRECRDILIEPVEVSTRFKVAEGFKLSADGYRHVQAWQQATQAMQLH